MQLCFLVAGSLPEQRAMGIIIAVISGGLLAYWIFKELKNRKKKHG